MTLDEIIQKIMEAENSISIEMEKDRYDYAADYVERAQSFLKQLVDMKDSLSPEDLLKAQDFAKAYAEHIKEQVKFLAVARAKAGEEYKNVRVRHHIASKYSSVKHTSTNNNQNISDKS